jgi:hypothetical protein
VTTFFRALKSRLTVFQTLVCVACMSILLSSAASETVLVRVYPTPTPVNQSCQIMFEVTGASIEDPDFGELETSFEILSQNRQVSIKWINGKREQSTAWTLSAIPLQAGLVTIPSIDFGRNKSIAKTIQIIDTPLSSSDLPPEIIVEVEVDTRSPYVQQQVIYSLRLYHRVKLRNPRLSGPKTDKDAEIKHLDDKQFVETINGVSYDAIEARYVIFPFESGTTTIQPITLTTQLVSSTRSLLDPFFSGNSQTRRTSSDSLKLEVKPIPLTYPRDAVWLPSQEVRLTDLWNTIGPEPHEVGKPVSRTMLLEADGLMSSQAPEIKFPTPESVRIYPEQPISSEETFQDGFRAIYEQNYAVIGHEIGMVTFPEMRIPWWNVISDQLEYAEIKKQNITFIPQPTRGQTIGSAKVNAVIQPPTQKSSLWRHLTLATLVIWLFTLLLWRYQARNLPDDSQRKTEIVPNTNNKVTYQKLKRACEANRADLASQALSDWDEHATQHSVSPHLKDLQYEIAKLERHLYGREPTPWSGSTLLEAFHRVSTFDEKNSRKEEDAILPALFKLVK